ncbi:MAG TPA: carboxypeptidase regulatory-like domain-containing protein, partial [Verrucomicrobiota bacterium]|nr:carboxypeptidase regulatory-like domain-containing protein [Verrucomicrobiota bacterium]
PAATNAVMAQQHLQFETGLLPVQTGTAVEFPNLDPLFHNVFSYSRPRRFDLGRYAQGERPPPQRFDRPGVVRLNCEIHPHMRATILVLSTPHFTRTDTNGAFRLTGLPAGRHTLKAWVEEKDGRVRTVELTAGTTLTVDFPAP